VYFVLYVQSTLALLSGEWVSVRVAVPEIGPWLGQ
jgi:hypothetical protein